MQHVQDTAQTDWLLLKPRTQTGTALREPELRDMMSMGHASSFLDQVVTLKRGHLIQVKVLLDDNLRIRSLSSGCPQVALHCIGNPVHLESSSAISRLQN